MDGPEAEGVRPQLGPRRRNAKFFMCISDGSCTKLIAADVMGVKYFVPGNPSFIQGRDDQKIAS